MFLPSDRERGLCIRERTVRKREREKPPWQLRAPFEEDPFYLLIKILVEIILFKEAGGKEEREEK